MMDSHLDRREFMKQVTLGVALVTTSPPLILSKTYHSPTAVLPGDIGLVEKVKDIVDGALLSHRLELPDQITRDSILTMVDINLKNLQARRAVGGYKIICDETNNPPDTIDRNEAVAEVLFVVPGYFHQIYRASRRVLPGRRVFDKPRCVDA